MPFSTSGDLAHTGIAAGTVFIAVISRTAVAGINSVTVLMMTPLWLTINPSTKAEKRSNG